MGGGDGAGGLGWRAIYVLRIEKANLFPYSHTLSSRSIYGQIRLLSWFILRKYLR
jgi:hypothetical protein